MSKTQGTLVKELRSRVNEPSPNGFLSDEEIRAWVNEGAREVARRTEALRTSTTIAVTAGTQDYTAPVDSVRVHRLEWKPTGSSQRVPLVYRDRQAMDVVWGTHQAITESWWPEWYSMWGVPPTMTITLYPTPTSAGSLYCYYYKLPAALSVTGTAATTTLDIPEGWEDLILSYAEARARLKQQRADLYQIAQGQFRDLLSALQETSTRYTDAPGQVTPDFGWMSEDYGGY
jgi:hypothetical protein